MDELRFDGRVAIVTGAGRGIGRAYALLLAARGAAVVVNDLGTSMGGDGGDEGPAAGVVEEIAAAGGHAVADAHAVADPDAAAAIVATAIERFGRIDAVLNNAGIMRWAGMPSVDAADLEAHLAVHVGGSFNVTRAAWPHFVEQGYGRVVMTGSAGMFGLPANTAYAAAKGAIVGMTNSLAVAGAEHGIRVNVIAPAAVTRMAGPGADEHDPTMSPDLVAPMAACLAHESCPVSGEIYTAGGGRFARIVIASTPGWVDDSMAPTMEDVASHWATITDDAETWIPTDLLHWSSTFLEHLDNDA